MSASICLADLPNDPCAKKIQPNVDKCLLAKVPDYDPDNTNPKYYCCITWIANDCYESVGKTKCSSSKLKTMDQLLDNMKKVYNDGQCKVYPYQANLNKCAKS
ncbi:unnamed protein product [Medioppia subpectinata]|uniref:Uncharacterized protein n=1 Tax=Medioppia subpectinata TaxID=1979941 RepID=A0A7R9KNT5_9ACAR|nr:unnamed protein product [Medioppia subpectinata]CAG2106650.1 unnamed protein product [Medioppia subpectinata]